MYVCAEHVGRVLVHLDVQATQQPKREEDLQKKDEGASSNIK